jgi:hypothetical protein
MNSSTIHILLKLKKTNEQTIFFLNDLINFNSLENSDPYLYLSNLYEEYKKLNNLLNKSIIQCCPHEFIEDDIDISPDESRRITYCKICENNLDDCCPKK